MKNFYAFWLCPNQEDSYYLSEIIQHLALEYKSQTFIPHLTLFGSVLMEKQQGMDIINSVTEGRKQFTAEVEKVDSSEEFFKTLFIKIRHNDLLNDLQHDISDFLKEHVMYEFDPHISLLYQYISREQKIQLVKNITLKPSLLMSSVALVDLGQTENDIYTISKWNIVYSKPLQ